MTSSAQIHQDLSQPCETKVPHHLTTSSNIVTNVSNASGDLQLALSNEPNCSQIALVHSSSSLKRDPPEWSATQSPTPTKLVITQLILAVPKWEYLEGSKNFFRCRRFPDKTKDRLDPKRRTEKHDDSSIPSPSGPGN